MKNIDDNLEVGYYVDLSTKWIYYLLDGTKKEIIYPFSGIILSKFLTLEGAIMYAVENKAGIVRLFNTNELLYVKGFVGNQKNN